MNGWPWPAPKRVSAQAAALASFSTTTGSPVRCSTAARNGSLRQARLGANSTVERAASTNPAAPEAGRLHLMVGGQLADAVGDDVLGLGGILGRGVASQPGQDAAVGVHHAGGHLGPADVHPDGQPHDRQDTSAGSGPDHSSRISAPTYYPAMNDTGLSELVGAAAKGDQRAWQGLVERFSGLVWSVARAYGLSEADAADVAQTAWLRLVENLHRVRDAQRVGAWLATTARHEALRTLRVAGRQLPVGDDAELEPSDPVQVTPETLALASEQRSILWQAFAALPPSCQRLLRVLMADPPPSYQEAAAALGMPIGSIGPTRGRCLDRLRRLADL